MTARSPYAVVLDPSLEPFQAERVRVLQSDTAYELHLTRIEDPRDGGLMLGLRLVRPAGRAQRIDVVGTCRLQLPLEVARALGQTLLEVVDEIA